MSSKTKDVLIVLPTPRDKAALKDVTEGYRFHWMDDENFFYPNPRLEFDMVGYTERCSEYIQENNIQAILYSHDLSNLVAGVLCERHGLLGPSLESMFLANHKYYSRRTETHPIWWALCQGTFQKSLYKAMVYLSCGELERCYQESPRSDPSLLQRMGGQFHVITYGEGKAGDFLDYDFAGSVMETEVEIFVPEDFEIRKTRTSGFWLARFHLYGSDFNEICQRGDQLRSRMLKRPELSPRPNRDLA